MKRDVFEEVGGFSGNQHGRGFRTVAHTKCALYPMSIMSAGPGLWREHEDQQSNDLASSRPAVGRSSIQLLGLEKVLKAKRVR